MLLISHNIYIYIYVELKAFQLKIKNFHENRKNDGAHQLKVQKTIVSKETQEKKALVLFCFVCYLFWSKPKPQHGTPESDLKLYFFFLIRQIQRRGISPTQWDPRPLLREKIEINHSAHHPNRSKVHHVAVSQKSTGPSPWGKRDWRGKETVVPTRVF